jgi:copper chaperone CopZ
MTSVTLSVPEISCDTCKIAIEGALRPLAGVREASVDVAARQVRVEFDESVTSWAALADVIQEQGYEVPGSG